ncbi:YdcF family protein [Amycolatopsis sp. FBCC-B4732]|uniref:YdcF family protein n=1 Tax=Amycolatopsis sp. FBCC-B4732 TaxID=3079339 RepID=UPI001FF20CE1|nr:YdcF family protein [Amycolatopsis sp. FBCC-B4732]UOX84957.1 YdcF family protein [Amycolatopsis sp. FBCC-B4732]
MLPEHLRADVATLWAYHDLRHEPRRSDVGVGLGSRDPGVAVHTAELFHAGRFPLVVFTGANAPTTIERFPRGEAVHYRDIARELGVPDDVILVEPEARNTGDNIAFTRRLLAGREIRSVTLVTRPYQQRRAYATAKRLWPGVDFVCASKAASFEDHVSGEEDVERVVSMLVGETQRVTEYAVRGFAIPQHVPAGVERASDRLAEAGFTQRLLRRPGDHSM